MNIFLILFVVIGLILLLGCKNVYFQNKNEDCKLGMVQMVIGNNSTVISYFTKAITFDRSFIDAY